MEAQAPRAFASIYLDIHWRLQWPACCRPLCGTTGSTTCYAASATNGYWQVRVGQEVEEALGADDLEACARIAHRFVSTSGTVGATQLARILKEIEQRANAGCAEDAASLVIDCLCQADGLVVRQLLRRR